MTMEEAYGVKVNAHNKAIELKFSKSALGRDSKHGAHMRAFWGSTISFFMAFFGWFALSPVAVDVAESISICENQLYPPLQHPRREAYLKYKSVQDGRPYCRYGAIPVDAEHPTDCAETPADSTESRYDPSVLPSCVCTSGTHCGYTLTYAALGSVGVTTFVRIALGTLLERFGPTNVQASVLAFGACWVALSAIIWDEWSLILINTMIGCVGATFVTTQFWCSLMFAPNVVGTANATAAGWGNLGGGVTQIFIVWCLVKPIMFIFNMSISTAWRSAMLVPAALFLLCAAGLKLWCQDTPSTKRFSVVDTGKSLSSLWDYVDCAKDFRVIMMMFQYGACFGTELAMNAKLATHFRVYFQLDSGDASILAGSFGLMNLAARSLGGIVSDTMYLRFGFRGRLWAQFATLLLEGILLMAFACVDDTQPWYVALVALVFFSLFVQMAEGTSYGIVPFMNEKQIAIVTAVVGAGGNFGAVIVLWCFYRPLATIDDLLPFKVHAVYVIFWAFMTVLYYWPDKGGMLCRARDALPAHLEVSTPRSNITGRSPSTVSKKGEENPDHALKV